MIRNVAGFVKNPELGVATNKRVKFLFVGDSLGNLTSTTRYITTYLYSNYDAYINNYQAVFYEQSTLINNCYYPSRPTSGCSYSHQNHGGLFELLKISDTLIRASFKP